ncbi:hydroxyacid oxidase 2 [Folsomia candida]|uniref:hydroxyacid oxidase 2 n=1 Tax=Folsomia candida TaxID=158441 RepID=UPI000B8F4DC2|nr:hydroxyacid oxidase 2 [Folsomia candida]
MEKFLCVQDFYEAAKSKLTKDSNGSWEYFEGIPDEGWALDQNRKAFKRYVIRPRILRDVSAINLTTTILGIPASIPIGVAPTSKQALFHPDGECGVARAAGRSGAIYVLSTLATASIEEVAAAAPKTRLWFQLYYQKDIEVNKDLLIRAEKSGYEAVVLTVDCQIPANRLGFKRKPWKLPEMQEQQVPEDMDPSMDWNVVKWIREQTKMKLILKGILTGEDAKLAVEHGVDAIIVSNHGGRQLDSVMPAIDVLPEVVASTKSSNVEVYLDGGITLGSDVFKALALGAKMVFIGRTALAGLTVGGEQGAAKVLEILTNELDKTMALAGVTDLGSNISSKFIQNYKPFLSSDY